MTQRVECLANKHKGLSSNAITQKKKRKEQEEIKPGIVTHAYTLEAEAGGSLDVGR
jgi:hypothetical protein